MVTTTYIQKRYPAKTLVDKTPFEVFYGSSLNVGHFKIFGSVCYAHVPKHKRSKLDRKAIKCIFVGYSQASKGYRLWNPDTRSILVTRDVKFAKCDTLSDTTDVRDSFNAPLTAINFSMPNGLTDEASTSQP